jgi:DNA-binding winged helix-turn-helix (wHTH) protein
MRLEFDGVTFDAESRQLWRDGRELRLSPKAFDLLALLIERRPHAVCKEDIHAHLWPSTFVSASNLPALITEVRTALGETAEQPRLIRTLHRFGYAFQSDHSSDSERKQPEVRAWLVGESLRLPLLAGENILGREGPGVIAVRSSTVSRRHARVIIGAGRATVEDLGSKNGTFVNAHPVSGPTPLKEGDQLRTGSIVFTFTTQRIASPSETKTATASNEL